MGNNGSEPSDPQFDAPSAPTVKLGQIRVPGAVTSTAGADTPLPTPTTLAGEYELVGLLGRGGMGVVYLAYQRALKRKVAYKVLTHFALPDPEALERFRSEAKLLAKLQHPNIVQVFDSGACDGTPYLTMEYVPGGSLARHLLEGRPTPKQAAGHLAIVARAVGHAHIQGIIHRDLNPANILISAEGQPKVADFGLARDLDAVRLTCTGQVAGTLLYMAPEQLNGNGTQTPAVDVWALGVILHEMLTGAPPFAAGDQHQIITNVLRQEPVPIRSWQPHVPRDLETICLKCLQKDPQRRYSTGNELADDLQRFLDNRPILARPVSSLEKCWRWCWRNPLAACLTIGITVLLLSGSIVSLALANWAMGEHAKAAAAARTEAEFRQEAERQGENAAMAAKTETELRQQAERAANTEAALRQQAELAVEAEKKALAAETKSREEVEAMAAMLESLLTGIRQGNDVLGDLRRELGRTAAQLKNDQRNPILRARLAYTLAITRRNLGDFKPAVELMETAFALRKEYLGPNHPETQQAQSELAYSYVHLGRGDDAAKLVRSLLEVEERKYAADSEKLIPLLSLLAVCCGTAGRDDERETVGKRIVAICEKHHGKDGSQTHWARANLAVVYRNRGRYDLAIPMIMEAWEYFRVHCGKHSVEILWTRGQLGHWLRESGKVEEALPLLQSMYEGDVEFHGATHQFTILAGTYLAECYEEAQQFAKAVPLRQMLRDYYEKIGNKEAAVFNGKRLAEDRAAVSK